MKKKNNKGAVELSLNLIIMLIIGLVVLGLVISFVTSLINKGSSQFSSQLSSNQQDFLKNLGTSCSNNLCVQSYSSNPITNIKVGQSGELGIFVRNYQTTNISCLPGLITSNSCSGEIQFQLYNSNSQVVSNNYELNWNGLSLNSGQSGTAMVTLTTQDQNGSKLQPGTYYLKISLFPSKANSPSPKTITISVS